MVAAVGVSSAGTAAEGVALASTMQCSSRQCGSSSVAAAAVWQRQLCGDGSPVALALQYQHLGGVIGQQ